MVSIKEQIQELGEARPDIPEVLEGTIVEIRKHKKTTGEGRELKQDCENRKGMVIRKGPRTIRAMCTVCFFEVVQPLNAVKVIS